jgi:peptide/nickel transport system substrate-binding protein
MEPRHRNILVIGIVVVLVAAGVGGYFVLRKSSVSATCASGERTTVCIDQAELPDSLDPDVAFSSPGWGAVQQVYQGLVQYNGTSTTNFSGILAHSNWTESYNPDTGFTSYTFYLRAGAHFSNGDPYNAYVQWYSLYRSLLLIQGPQFILEQNFFSTNFSETDPLNYSSDISAVTAANTTLASDLNSWDFFNPTPAEIANMSEPEQSFQVISPSIIQLNLGYGYLDSNYTYLLAALSSPNSYAVDPTWIDANGGLVVGDVSNDYLNTHTLGTGQFLLQNYNPVEGGGYTLVPDSNYWGRAAAAAEPWNNNLQPANTTFDIIFQPTLDVTISALEGGTIASAEFDYIGPSSINDLKGHSNLVVRAMPIGVSVAAGAWWVYLNESTYPFDNLSVREAIAHAINYNEIINQSFGGYGQQWVGPVPPSYPYYNPLNLPPYAYNLSLAQQEIASSPCANRACAGVPFNYEYLDIGASWAETAQFIASDLGKIGITVNPLPISLPDLYVEQSVNSNGVCNSATNTNGGPFYMGQEFYSSDYVSPDDWTQNDAESHASANMCMSGYANATMDDLIYSAAAESDPANLTQDYTNITQMMYDNYVDIWLVVPTSFDVHATNLQGIIINAMGDAEPSCISFNTMWLS